jgi:ribose transport system substrate-binding protein
VKKKTLALMAFALAIAVIAAGCGSSSSSSSSTAETTESSGAAEAESTGGSAAGETEPASSESSSDPVKAAEEFIAEYTGVPKFTAPGPAFEASKASGKTVWVIPTNSSIPIVPLVDGGMEEALAKVGVKTHEATTTGSTSDWVNGMNQAIAQGAGAIVLLSVDPNLLKPQIAEAEKAGIPVIWNFAIEGKVSEIQPDIAATVPLPFKLSAELVAADGIIQGEGKTVALPVGTAEARQDPIMLEGQKKEYETCPECKMEEPMNSTLTEWSTQLGNNVRNALLANSEINYVSPNYDGMEEFIVAAIRQANPSGGIKTGSFNGTPAVIKEIGGGIVTADVGQSNRWIGWATADQVLRVLAGETPSEEENIPVRVWNEENVGEATGANDEDGYGEAYVAGYEKLWGVGG